MEWVVEFTWFFTIHAKSEDDLEASEPLVEIKSKDPTKVELTREIRERDVQR